jgi:hypothetical protein
MDVTKLNELEKTNETIGDKLSIIKLDNSKAKKGEGFYLNLSHWEELPCHVVNDHTIGIGRPYSEHEVKVYVQFEKISEVEVCETYLIFPYDSWIDYRSPRGETKFQKAKMKGDTGTIYIAGVKVLNARVFTPVETEVNTNQVNLSKV